MVLHMLVFKFTICPISIKYLNSSWMTLFFNFAASGHIRGRLTAFFTFDSYSNFPSLLGFWSALQGLLISSTEQHSFECQLSVPIRGQNEECFIESAFRSLVLSFLWTKILTPLFHFISLYSCKKRSLFEGWYIV